MSEIPEMNPIEWTMSADAGAMLLDVREDDEWQAGHARVAVHIPMGQVIDRLDELPGDRPIVVVCRSGGRSALVTEALIERGFLATNLAGGMQAWESAALEIVGADGRAGVVA